MSRTRQFNIQDAIRAAAGQFLATGYEGTSIDDLVRATGVHRGSLYSTFGSKRDLFLAAMDQTFAPDGDDPPVTSALDLALVALLELAPRDVRVRQMVSAYVGTLGEDAAGKLGRRLIQRAGLGEGSVGGIGDEHEQSHTS